MVLSELGLMTSAVSYHTQLDFCRYNWVTNLFLEIVKIITVTGHQQHTAQMSFGHHFRFLAQLCEKGLQAKRLHHIFGGIVEFLLEAGSAEYNIIHEQVDEKQTISMKRHNSVQMVKLLETRSIVNFLPKISET